MVVVTSFLLLQGQVGMKFVHVRSQNNLFPEHFLTELTAERLLISVYMGITVAVKATLVVEQL